MIIAITLNAVAATDKRIINREKDFCLLKAIRRAISKARFKRHDFGLIKTTLRISMQQKHLGVDVLKRNCHGFTDLHGFIQC
jgi:hypothetical protein